MIVLSPLAIRADYRDWISSGRTMEPAVLQGDQRRLDILDRDFHFRIPATPYDITEYLKDYPASDLNAEARLMLADWFFFNRSYPLALQNYSLIPDNAFSGDTKNGMTYRKAFSMVKCGFYSEAATSFRKLRGTKEYGEAARFYLAYIDYVGGRYDEAYSQFKNIKGNGPLGAEAEYYLNQMDYRNGEYRKVANTSERLLSTGKVPEEMMAETMRVGALSYFKTGDKTTARKMLTQYLDLTGDGAEISALYALGTMRYEDGDYDGALPLFSTVTEYPGALAQSSWLYIGQIHAARGDAAAASMAFDKASRESWDNSVAETGAYNMAVAATEGMSLPFSDAAAAMENFIESYPLSPYSSSLSSYLANAYYGRRDYEKALRHVEKVGSGDAAIRETRQKILYQLGGVRLQEGNTHEAVKLLTEASGGPDREVAAQASLWLGDALYAEKNYAAAAKAYEKALASGLSGDNRALAQYDLGYACMKLRQYSKAEAAFKEATSLPGLTPAQKSDARLRYADCLYYNGKYAQALTLFRDIKLEGGSEAVFARIREADILGREGKVNEKISILEALEGSPEASIWNSAILSRLADAYSEKGDDRRAAELYARMIDSSGAAGDNSQTYYSLAANAENLYDAGDFPSTYTAYKRLEKSGIPALYPIAVTGIMRTSGDNAEIEEYASRVAALPGLPADEADEAALLGAKAGMALGGAHETKALETLRTLALSPERTRGAEAAVILGEFLLKKGNTAEAERVLLKLTDSGSDDNYWLARGYIALADVYMAQDKDYLAKLYLETLQGNYPGNEKDIRQMIGSRLKSLDK